MFHYIVFQLPTGNDCEKLIPTRRAALMKALSQRSTHFSPLYVQELEISEWDPTNDRSDRSAFEDEGYRILFDQAVACLKQLHTVHTVFEFSRPLTIDSVLNSVSVHRNIQFFTITLSMLQGCEQPWTIKIAAEKILHWPLKHFRVFDMAYRTPQGLALIKDLLRGASWSTIRSVHWSTVEDLPFFNESEKLPTSIERLFLCNIHTRDKLECIPTYFPNLSTLFLGNERGPDIGELWIHLCDNNIHLRRLHCTWTNSLTFIRYLGSYTGLFDLSIGFGHIQESPPDANIIQTFYDTISSSHRTCLKTFRIADNGFGSSVIPFDGYSSKAIAACSNLEALRITVGEQEGINGETNPIAKHLLNAIVLLPRLKILGIRFISDDRITSREDYQNVSPDISQPLGDPNPHTIQLSLPDIFVTLGGWDPVQQAINFSQHSKGYPWYKLCWDSKALKLGFEELDPGRKDIFWDHAGTLHIFDQMWTDENWYMWYP
ncbi:hypothetical protein DL96DRAFT_1703381 [Flagelloscypha sp. PMI_526]|nr:hypothetical protein DL96DRAFT_1703381 [Flagelloscypha sp. PMI_526]